MRYEFEAPIKDPQSVLFHSMDWSTEGWLRTGETITTTPEVISDKPELLIDQITQADGIVQWRVSGVQAEVNYLVTVRVETSDGRIDDRTVLYKVRQR